MGGFLGGRFLESYGIMVNFQLCIIFCFVGLTIGMIYKEERQVEVVQQRGILQELKLLSSLLFRDKVFSMVCFVMLLNATPTFDTLSQFYMTDRLNFSETDLANFSTIGSISYIIGLIVYSKYLVQKNPKTIYFATNFLWLAVNVSFLLVVFDQVKK